MHAITNDADQGLVTTTFTGDVSTEERCCSLDEILSLARSTGASRMLVDFSAAQFRAEGLETARRLARRIAAHDEALRKLRIAYVMPDNKVDPAVEILARGRGLFAERFGSAQAAREWLLNGPAADVAKARARRKPRGAGSQP